MRTGALKSELPIAAMLLLMAVAWLALRNFPQPPASP